ncbi:MAG: FAD-dependent oxidoreductase [Deltaproteobacteria bacterium]|nr:FAD-dependent oxidoreductase [Deltaproteobacteria bacterium]
MKGSSPSTVAVIGSGISGITAAYLLQKRFKVTLLEKDARIGGHTNTIVIPEGPDKGTPVDTGFIVLNDKTYPNLHRLLAAWGVEVRFSDMSFGFHCRDSGLQYSGRGLNGLFAQRMNMLSLRHLRLIREIILFCRGALAEQELGNNLHNLTLAEYLKKCGFSDVLAQDYLVPMGSAIWSAIPDGMLSFPAATFISFFKNHGLLSLKERPRWQTIVGGSHQYLRAFEKSFSGEIKHGAEVLGVSRRNGKVEVTLASGEAHTFDQVVLAVHADQVLSILKDSTPLEQRIFTKWRYQKNTAFLHTDISVLPPNRRAWASWNYLRERGSREILCVTYDMNRLQGLQTACHYLVTLNAAGLLDDRKIIREIEYHHPVYDSAAAATQQELSAQQGEHGTWFCGSYCGYGFHEDGARSAVQVAEKLGCAL